MMAPTDVLMEEHRVIELVLSCLDRIADDCVSRRQLDMESATQAVEFFRVFADERHHSKEEELLFPMMEARGFVRDQGPTGVMIHEHELGRRRVRDMADAIQETASGSSAGAMRFVELARSYSALLRQHIQKEDHCLFQMAIQVLSAADQAELGRQFEKVEAERFGRDTHDRCIQMATDLAGRLGLADAAVHAEG